MMTSVINHRWNGESPTIPITAIPVQVVNINNPYSMRICEIKDYKEKLKVIHRKLLYAIKKNQLDIVNTKNEPKTGDVSSCTPKKISLQIKLRSSLEKAVVVQNKKSLNIDLPGWWCRGVVSEKLTNDNKYLIFLVDYGNSVELFKEDLVIVSKNIIPEKYLSTTIGIYNILPCVTTKNSSGKEKTTNLVGLEWTQLCIKFSKELIRTASDIHFEPLARGENDKTYGDLYLTIENEILSLSRTLVHNRHAVYLHDELLDVVDDPASKSIEDTDVEEIKIYTDQKDKKNVSNGIDKNIQESVNSHHNEPNQIRLKTVEKSKCLEDDRQKVFIYSTHECECLSAVVDARFPAPIHQVWDSSVRSPRPKRIQSYMWPAYKKALNVVAIGTSGSGKTYGYTVAVSGSIAAHHYDLPRGTFPVVLVLCSSSIEVLKVHCLFEEFLQHYEDIRAVAALNGKSDKSVMAEIYNGCQVLISTPQYLVRFMNRNKTFISFEKLQHLVIDNADIIFEKYQTAIKELIGRYKIIATRERKDVRESILQMSFVAKHWTPLLKKWVALMDTPYICIASFIEATIFKSIHPKMYLILNKRKNEEAMNLIKNQNPKNTFKTMVVCTTAQEAEEFNKYLVDHKDVHPLETLLAHENMNSFDLLAIKTNWDSCVFTKYRTLICTDEVLSNINITDVDWLIHYSIMLNFKSQFNFRFSTLMNNLKKRETKCQVSIIVDEKNNVQFLSLTKLMKRMKIPIQNNIEEAIGRISITLDRNKMHYPICNGVKSLGFCPYTNYCSFRHCILPECDNPMTNISIGDKVKFMILYVHNATHFSARIVAYYKSNTMEKIEYPNEEYIRTRVRMQEYYANVDNRKRCSTVNVGDICTYMEGFENFQRVQVLNIRHQESDQSDDLQYVDIRCIDNGIVKQRIHTYLLLDIPEELSQIKTHVVEVFMTDLAPYDDEYFWNHCADNAVSEWFKEHLTETSFITGTVNLHLSNTIWVDTLKVVIGLVDHSNLTKSCLKTELIKKQYAIVNKDHLRGLYKMCRKGDLSTINESNIPNLIDIHDVVEDL